MTQLLVLSEHDITKTFTIADAIGAVEDAYVQKAKGTGVAWPMVYEQFAPGEADMDIRSGELAGSGLFGLKLTAWFGANPERGLPEIFGTVLLCDDRTGEPLALLNGSALTGMRTGAAGALGVAHLARKDARTLLVCGAGHQAAFQIAATLILRPAIDHVMVWEDATQRLLPRPNVSKPRSPSCSPTPMRARAPASKPWRTARRPWAPPTPSSR